MYLVSPFSKPVGELPSAHKSTRGHLSGFGPQHLQLPVIRCCLSRQFRSARVVLLRFGLSPRPLVRHGYEEEVPDGSACRNHS
jgi:hypothetical protein